ncbi:hypothetical protein J2Q04_13580 [Tenacibaculum finnmarkense genomovar finnmarkense]|uniref:Uncharacterized protein n=2 Tax=Tenacibaculum piscium TaxID=1458515 RepID=A0A2H1YHB0_9FLAO|nr:MULTISPECIES: hypothetical protein [Tenacibaculum]MCD8449466.1 hypothetical protein [Tenacibaculum dicentrarchi]MBE7630078.1 hypothetical protein [Tenacibaculum piscium]MBE7661073.1 hypothetical protein [Tenacibaculum finnmarkense genomovar finnmarkense]MBE7671595.1 hypothetical protein [Tenacibaculum piscium]MBE7686493.1 hypothetical protein [Tenacibaculum piscium]
MALKEVSKEVKETLKKEHGDKLKSLILPLDDFNIDELEVLAIIPKRSVVGQTMKFMQSDPKKGQEILVKNCLLTSKEEVVNDDGLFYAVAGLLMDLIPIRQGKFGKV